VTSDLRARVAEAERLLDEGDYTGAVREAAETYAALVLERPDMRFAPPRLGELPVTGGKEPGQPPRFPWPEEQGVTVSFVEGAAPEIVLAKSRYTMSDAITYLEYVVDVLGFAEREPPPA
jgi:hypothetical protein